MADYVNIELWINRRWKDAIEKYHLKDETLKQHMKNVLRDLCNQLPQRVIDRIDREIWQEDFEQASEDLATVTNAACCVTEDGQTWYLSTQTGGDLLDIAETMRNHITDKNNNAASIFIDTFGDEWDRIQEGTRDMLAVCRMKNIGNITGVFDIDFDKQEFSAVNDVDGWRTWAMRDVIAAVEQAIQGSDISLEERHRILLSYLEGREITSAGHLSARNVSFGDEIIESDGKLNFCMQTNFDMDTAFGTFVCTDENDDWLNVCANYDIEQDTVCDTLELNLCKADGTEDSWHYPLNAAEKEVLLRKMEEFCQQQTGMGLHEYSQQFREELEQEQGPEMKL